MEIKRTNEHMDHILSELKEIWSKYPQLRLGQLIANAIADEQDLYFDEDEKLVEKVKNFYDKIAK